MGEIPPNLSTPFEKAGFLSVQGIATGFLLTGVELWKVHGFSIIDVLPLWIIAVSLSYAGFKWSDIKPKLQVWRASDSRAARRFFLGTVIAVTAIASYVVLNQLFFVYRIRADMDTFGWPRELSNSQSETISKSLRGRYSKGVITVVYKKNDQEAKEYASRLINAIKAGGWNVQDHEYLDPWVAPDPWVTPPEINAESLFDPRCLVTEVGLQIHYGFIEQRKNGTLPNLDSEKALVAAFNDAGVTLGGGNDDAPNKGVYPAILAVCQRPLTQRRDPRLRDRIFRWIWHWE